MGDRFVGEPHPAVRELLAGRGYGAVRSARSPGRLVVPAEPSVSLIVTVSEPGAVLTGAGGPYRGGGADAPTAWVAVTLNPIGAYRVIGPAVLELAGQLADAADVFGAAGRVLAERVRAESSWSERFALLDRFLLARAERGEHPAAEIGWLWRRLAAGDHPPIGRLAGELGWSHQQLIKRCRQQLGLPPKTLARILRFRSAVRRIRRDGRLAPAILDAGYYDQPHFCRDLKEFTGVTPTDYLARALPCGCIAAA